MILINYGWPHTFHKFCNTRITPFYFLLNLFHVPNGLLWSMRHPLDVVRVGAWSSLLPITGVAKLQVHRQPKAHMLRCPTSHMLYGKCHVTAIINGHTGTLSHCSSHCNSFKDRVPIQAPDLQMSFSDFDENDSPNRHASLCSNIHDF